ncbi:MAG: CoA-binding protein, partial [Nitrosopumilales archaeon CG15_BIG_FIL_POST_REV_8_21_14_020_33_23]
MECDSYTDDEIRDILTLKRVAVIGMSKNEHKAAHYVPKYLSENGFSIIPVNPTTDEILGKRCYSTISDINDDVDIIDVFRPSELPPQQEVQAIKKNPTVIWLQEGIHNLEAEKMAQE